MGISIKNDRTERLARELARETGESHDGHHARARGAARARRDPQTPGDKLALARIVLRRIDALPVLDDRSPDEILGYDEYTACAP